VSDTHEDLHARAVLIGLAEPLERLGSMLDKYSEVFGEHKDTSSTIVSQELGIWSRWCRARAREARMWGKAEEGK
jgi:hypothetical protein